MCRVYLERTSNTLHGFGEINFRSIFWRTPSKILLACLKLVYDWRNLSLSEGLLLVLSVGHVSMIVFFGDPLGGVKVLLETGGEGQDADDNGVDDSEGKSDVQVVGLIERLHVSVGDIGIHSAVNPVGSKENTPADDLADEAQPTSDNQGNVHALGSLGADEGNDVDNDVNESNECGENTEGAGNYHGLAITPVGVVPPVILEALLIDVASEQIALLVLVSVLHLFDGLDPPDGHHYGAEEKGE